MIISYVLFGCCFFLFLYFFITKHRKLPPGPYGFPILGYLPMIDSKAPHKTLTKLARKYGPICGLQLGSVYTILLSDPQLVRQVLAKDVFTGRAPLYVTHGIMGGYGIVCAEGALWREQRKFAAGCLKNLGMMKFGPKRDKMEERILSRVEECVAKLKERSVENGVNPLETLHHCMGNLINDLVFGKMYEEDDKVWQWLRYLQEEGVKHIGVAAPMNFLPILRFFPKFGNTVRSLIDGKVKTHDLYRAIVEEHRGRSEKTDSFLAAFDAEMTSRKKINDLGYFTETQFYHLLADLFGAGTDTTLTTLRWFLLFMAVHTDVQDKIWDEMVETLNDKPLRLEDRPSLIRLEAAICETQRIRSVTPLGIPHGTIEKTQVEGYEIPKGTMVIPLQWAIHTDPTYWEDPFAFKPERFISEDGGLTKPEAFLPFQCGKRLCIGEELARMILFLFAGRIIQAFSISVPPNTSVDLEGEAGITLVPQPHRLLFTPRR